MQSCSQGKRNVLHELRSSWVEECRKEEHEMFLLVVMMFSVLLYGAEVCIFGVGGSR